jgi:hypothetical protein
MRECIQTVQASLKRILRSFHQGKVFPDRIIKLLKGSQSIEVFLKSLIRILPVMAMRSRKV